MRRETLAGVARPLRQSIDPHMPLEAPLQCRAEIVLVLRDVHGARDADLHRVEGAALRLGIRLELRDMADDVLGQIVLPEQQIVAAPRYLGDRALAASAHPKRRVRPLCRWRLDDYVVELPVASLM